MSADHNLNLGGNADLIRPKYIVYTWDFFLPKCLLDLTNRIGKSPFGRNGDRNEN